jgi:predicted membrane protein
MIVTAFGATGRTAGPWDARAASPVVTLVGSTELDFTLAGLGEGETEVVIVSGLGGVEVTVPADVPVRVTGLTLLGERAVLGRSDGGALHGADVASPGYAAATGRRLRLAIVCGLGALTVRRAPHTPAR